MKTESSANSMKNMKMIAAAIVVVIIIVVGAVLLTRGKSNAPIVTTSILATTTVKTANSTISTSNSTKTTATVMPTTTIQTSVNASPFQDWQGQNLTLSQFSSQMDHFTFTKANMANVTYNYKSAISFSGKYAFSENITGTTTVEKYYNDSRIATTSNSTYGAISSVLIYNSTSNKQYDCTNNPVNPSISCYLLNQTTSIVNSTGILGSVGSNVTVSGYYNNVKVSSTSYNGDPCTLVTGDLYLKTQTKKQPISTTVLQGTSAACISTQYNVWLNNSFSGTLTITANGNMTTANMVYGESEISMGKATSAAITALPGPVASS